MASPTLELSLALARDPQVPDKDLQASTLIRRRFFRGESIHAIGPVQKERQLISVGISTMRTLGFVFDVEKLPHPRGQGTYNLYTLKNPDHEPTAEQYEAAKYKAPKKAKATTVASRKTWGCTLCPDHAPFLAKESVKRHVRGRHAGVAWQNVIVEPEVAERPKPSKAVVKASTRTAHEVKAPTNGHVTKTMALGDTVQVFLLHLQDDGHTVVGLRSDEGSWLVRVEGFTET